jgi:hypothetical protein
MAVIRVKVKSHIKIIPSGQRQSGPHHTISPFSIPCFVLSDSNSIRCAIAPFSNIRPRQRGSLTTEFSAVQQCLIEQSGTNGDWNAEGLDRLITTGVPKQARLLLNKRGFSQAESADDRTV